MHEPQPPKLDTDFKPYDITRPEPILMWYYFLLSLLAGPAFVLALVPLYFRYITLRYHFDDKGISMSWGILWRREILLTYRRIQDIHLTRNIVQRWLGLATVSLQTASGSASAEMAIEGILQAEPLRDFLYAQMRGARGLTEPTEAASVAPHDAADEALVLLREIRDALARLAQAKGAAP
jgi:putative membrane protein